MTKFLNISTDTTLGGLSPSDELAVSQKAIKEYVDNHGGGGGSSTLAGLSDVTLTSPTDGQVLTYDNGTWINAESSGGYRPDLLDWKWADHILDDVQWLRADTFSWQDGGVYEAAYQHLVDDYNALPKVIVYEISSSSVQESFCRSPEFDVPGAAHPYAYTSYFNTSIITIYADDSGTILGANYYTTASGSTIYMNGNVRYNVEKPRPAIETIAGTKVSYFTAADGHKICPASQESNVAAIYNATGVAWYYILDTANQRFKLPRKHSTQIICSYSGVDGSWYRLYADGWVEQGGHLTWIDNPLTQITLPIVMDNVNYSVYIQQIGTVQDSSNSVSLTNRQTTAFTLVPYTNNREAVWQVCGQSGLDVSALQGDEKYRYFYVGNFTQSAIENTAGLNAELFNGKADINLTNAVANASATAKEAIVNWGIPDYSAGVSKSQNTDYTAEFSGRLICCTTSAYGGGGVDYITVDGQVVSTSTNSYEGYRGSLIADIAKGSSFRITKNTGETGWTYKFYPFKGVA